MISIILCSYNGAHKIERTLNSIISQETSFPWELVFIDNNSNDNTFLKAKSILEKSGIDFRVEHFSIPGKMFAFWHGISISKYDILLDCDDDNELFTDYLENGLMILTQNPNVGALGGLGILPYEHVPNWFNQFSKSYALGPQGKHLEVLPKFDHLYGAGCFYRKPILVSLRDKGFRSLLSCRKGDELSSGGDVEFCHAIQLSGMDLMYSESLKFYHNIEIKRINFDYYLKLKRGISLSFPILLSYRIHNFDSAFDFKKHLLLNLYLVIKGLIKIFILPKKSYSSMVDSVVVKTKFLAFFKNYATAVSGFRKNKTLFQ
ncbi:glycosyltransferase family 2 protein [Algoriphagus confluentis]|uniref:Glycosyltransferase 2-like domain-containing protein n=1 Tax=Algoriphagus confluentis TaxID=1697556 RepID=A0ABQ6PS45_9BACT|nr:hypothetical protein Aconfl_22150 [Algoriphagus confluentis]